MSVQITSPTYVYAQPATTIMEHLRTVAFTVDQLMELNGGMEPSDVLTEWRDDGPGEHNGWITLIKWPISIKLEAR